MEAVKINLKDAQAAEKVEFIKQAVNVVSHDYLFVERKLAKQEELEYVKTNLKNTQLEVKGLNNRLEGLYNWVTDQKSQFTREEAILQELKEKRRKIEELEQRSGVVGFIKELYQAYWDNIAKATVALFQMLKFIEAAAIQSFQISQEVEQGLTATSTRLVEAKAYRGKLATSSDQRLVVLTMAQKMMDLLDKKRAGQQCKVQISILATTIANLKSHIDSLILKGLPSPWTSNNKLIYEEEYMRLFKQLKKDQTNFDTWSNPPILTDVIHIIKPVAELEVQIHQVMDRTEDFFSDDQLELQRCYRQFKNIELPSEDEWKKIKASMDKLGDVYAVV